MYWDLTLEKGIETSEAVSNKPRDLFSLIFQLASPIMTNANDILEKRLAEREI